MAAGVLIQAGANVFVVQRHLGHASAAMVLDQYADFWDDGLDEIVAALSSQQDDPARRGIAVPVDSDTPLIWLNSDSLLGSTPGGKRVRTPFGLLLFRLRGVLFSFSTPTPKSPTLGPPGNRRHLCRGVVHGSYTGSRKHPAAPISHDS